MKLLLLVQEWLLYSSDEVNQILNCYHSEMTLTFPQY